MDNNLIGRVLLKPQDADFAEVNARLFRPSERPLRLVYDGKLLREYERNRNVVLQLRILGRTGRAIVAAAERLKDEEALLLKSKVCRSNDTHILALARVTKVRVMITEDRDLRADFKNPKIMKPRGKICQNPEHRKLIASGCRSSQA